MTVSSIELAAELAEDFDRILDHLKQHQVEHKRERLDDMITALSVLARNPYIGRPCGDGKRELIIGRRANGYVALYRYVADLDMVFGLAIRSQREAGLRREDQ